MEVLQILQRGNNVDQELNHFRIIARCNDERYVSYSNRGVVLLNWGSIILRLHPQEFIQLALLIKQGNVNFTEQKVLGWPIYLQREDAGGFSLNVHGANLLFGPADFADFNDLTQTALQRLGNR